MWHQPPAISMILVTIVVPLPFVAESLIRRTDGIPLCMPVQTLAPTIWRLVDAPLADCGHWPRDIGGLQLQNTGPRSMCRIATPTVVPQDGIAKNQRGKQGQCKEKTHDTQQSSSLRMIRIREHTFIPKIGPHTGLGLDMGCIELLGYSRILKRYLN